MAKELDLGWALGLHEREEAPWPVDPVSHGVRLEADGWRELLEETHTAGARSPESNALLASHPRATVSASPLLSPDPLSVEDLMRLVRHNDRVCPKIIAWRRMFLLLPNRMEEGRVMHPPYPVDSASVQMTTDVQKQLCLRRQFEWAESAGALEPIAEFIASLPEHDWDHLDTADWPALAWN
jgi:hypothetical protein